MLNTIGRNDTCPCGSGRRYKRCCGSLEEVQAATSSLDTSLPEAIQTALEYHRAGRWHQAETLARQILQATPNQPEALHLLGVIARQAGKNEMAVELFSRAISVSPTSSAYCDLGAALRNQGKLDEAVESFLKALAIKPDCAEAHFNLGIAFQQQGRLDAAIASYHKALAIKLENAEAHYNMGLALQQQGKPEAAAESYHQAVAIKPDFAEAHNNLGNALKDQGLLDKAVERYRQALAINADYADARYNLGLALQQLGDLEAAAEGYYKALAIEPDFAEALNSLGYVLKEQGKLDAAVERYHQALSIKPDLAEAHNNLGVALQQQGKLDAAVESYLKALSNKPNYAEAHNNLGLALNDQGKLDAAVESYRQALSINPDYAEAYSNLGNALQDQGELDAAVESYRQALMIKPDFAWAHYNLGIALDDQGKLDMALESYRKALALKPDFADARYNKSLTHLRSGDYATGWVEYESRWARAKTPGQRTFDNPKWLGGNPILGKRLLLWAEQGLGDTIQFCRYAPVLARKGAAVFLQVQSPLRSLLGTLEGVTVITADTEAPVAQDYHCPLGSLPLAAMRSEVPGIPDDVPYLAADLGRLRAWKQLIEHDGGRKIGIVCSGNPLHKNDRNRSMPLRQFSPLLDTECTFYLLQNECRPEDEAFLSETSQIRDLRRRLTDFTETAAVTACMDLVISVDTAVAHLAGALGKPVWILLPFTPDWRWMLGRDDSPWYPTARLFRQTERGNWQGVIEKVRQIIAPK